jgi:ligand-binding sensor domain-containing protein
MPLRRALFISLLINGLFALICRAQDNNVPFKHLTEADGLPDPTVRCFTQDRYGFIWFGTDNGLCRFDGRTVRSFVNIRHDQSSLPHNGVGELYTDSTGSVWVGTFQFLSCFDYATQTFQRFTLPTGNRVNSIIDVGNHTLWIATEQGILYFDRQKKRFTDGPLRDLIQRQRLANCRAFQLKTDGQGTIYAATDKGLKRIVSGDPNS